MSMDEGALERFASQLDADTEDIVERWDGRPDLIIDDIFRIRDQDTGKLRDLELFDPQRKLVHAYFFGDAGTLNAYKGRRIGFSFAMVASFLVEGLFYPESFYPIVSRTKTQSKDRISDITDLIENAKIEIPTEKTNTDYVELWNGTAFMAYSGDSDGSRGGDSARAVLMDEMAFIDDEEGAYEAFGAFIVLGKHRKMVEISTPNTKNDLFMQDHRRGSINGDNGVISIKQPTFENADEIDIDTPLHEQELIPAREGLNIDQLETQRMTDPVGFGQEYLCRPVADEYRFFSEESIENAISRDIYRPSPERRVMGVDIGINRDDTVISVMDHSGNQRIQRELVVVDDETLSEIGIPDPDRANANHIAKLIANIYNSNNVDFAIMDKGGPGETFQRIIERRMGRAVVPFDFSNQKDVAQMMGDMNVCLRSGNVSLKECDGRVFDELSSIVKEKRSDYSTPKFSGKDHSMSGKDDVAIATVLSAFPPKGKKSSQTAPSVREKESEPSGVYSSKDRTPQHQVTDASAVKINRQSRRRRNKYKSRSIRR